MEESGVLGRKHTGKFWRDTRIRESPKESQPIDFHGKQHMVVFALAPIAALPEREKKTGTGPVLRTDHFGVAPEM